MSAQVTLVTGGAAGIGRSLAEGFGERGDRIVLADLDEKRLEATAAELQARGTEVESVVSDVSAEDDVHRIVERAEERFGGLDVVVNNAGIVGAGGLIESLDAQDLRRVLAVNLEAPFLVSKHAVPMMKRGGGGSILNFSSIVAERGTAHFAPYAASKAGVVALTRSLARNLGRFNIRVNCIQPGSIRGTGLMSHLLDAEAKRQAELDLMARIPVGRVGRTRDVVAVALFLTSQDAAHLNGSVVTVDGGESLGFH